MAFLSDIFEYLNKNCNYAVLRSYENLPQSYNSRDVDIIINESEYDSIKSTLTANNIGLPGKTLLEGGLLGYNAKFIGWLDLLYWNSGEILRGGDEQMEYLTSDNLHIRLKKDGTFGVDGGVHPGNWYMRVRLIKE